MRKPVFYMCENKGARLSSMVISAFDFATYTEQKKKLYTFLCSHISANTNPRNIIFISNESVFNSQLTCVNETRM